MNKYLILLINVIVWSQYSDRSSIELPKIGLMSSKLEEVIEYFKIYLNYIKIFKSKNENYFVENEEEVKILDAFVKKNNEFFNKLFLINNQLIIVHNISNLGVNLENKIVIDYFLKYKNEMIVDLDLKNPYMSLHTLLEYEHNIYDIRFVSLMDKLCYDHKLNKQKMYKLFIIYFFMLNYNDSVERGNTAINILKSYIPKNNLYLPIGLIFLSIMGLLANNFRN